MPVILTLKKRRLGARKYYVFCRVTRLYSSISPHSRILVSQPIPLELLDVVSVNPSSLQPALIKGRRPESSESDAGLSFQIRHIGRKDRIWRLYPTKDHFQSEWLNQFSSALEIREMSMESRRVCHFSLDDNLRSSLYELNRCFNSRRST